MRVQPIFTRLLCLLSIAALAAGPTGCSDEGATSAPDPTVEDVFADAANKGVEIELQTGDAAPGDVVVVDAFGASFTFWPYTSAELDGTPMDPVNLLFTGMADPVAIRAALMGLDGDRTALGLPAAYPFDQVWQDAIGGGVQSTWTDDAGWVGSVIQLTLGEYEPVRFHLRLFRSPGSTVTVGAAHFEVLIPGTTDHQVLSWTAAKDLVVGDLMRSGLLNPATDLAPTGPITPAPGFRTILPAVYNALPPELLAVIGGPPPPVTDPVAIPNDGSAMMVRLVAPAAPVVGPREKTTTVTFGQYVPRPYCAAGPYDWLWIEGPVTFHFSGGVSGEGTYAYASGYEGVLTAVPVDIATGQPVGAPFTADVRGEQSGFLEPDNARVRAMDRKLTHEGDGTQIETIDFHLGERGRDRYRRFVRCIDE